MPPLFYNLFVSLASQIIAFKNTTILLQRFHLNRNAELSNCKCLLFLITFPAHAKDKPYFCKCHLFYKLLVFHSYGRASRLEMPPLFYDIFISSTWQSLSFLNAPIVLQFIHLFGLSEHSF